MSRGLFRVGSQAVDESATEVLTYPGSVEEGAFARLLQEMRLRSGLTFRALAREMGVSESSVHQYFYRQRGGTGSSTVRWLLRCAEACGCEVVVRFPPSTRRGRRAVMRHPRTLAEVFTDDDIHDETQSDA
jgi:transcriptional regulator with XRE-family HTH domain